MKKVLLLAATLAGALYTRDRVKRQQSEQKLWAEATSTGASTLTTK